VNKSVYVVDLFTREAKSDWQGQEQANSRPTHHRSVRLEEVNTFNLFTATYTESCFEFAQ